MAILIIYNLRENTTNINPETNTNLPTKATQQTPTTSLANITQGSYEELKSGGYLESEIKVIDAINEHLLFDIAKTCYSYIRYKYIPKKYTIERYLSIDSRPEPLSMYAIFHKIDDKIEMNREETYINGNQSYRFFSEPTILYEPTAYSLHTTYSDERELKKENMHIPLPASRMVCTSP